MHALKDTVDPKILYRIYFHDKGIGTLFNKAYTILFCNTVRLIKCNIFCEDIKDSDHQNNVISEYHDKNHNGITHNHLKTKYYWPDMWTKINKIINDCEICLQSKYERHPYNIKFSGPWLAKKPFAVIHIGTFSFDYLIIIFQIYPNLIRWRFIRNHNT